MFLVFLQPSFNTVSPNSTNIPISFFTRHLSCTKGWLASVSTPLRSIWGHPDFTGKPKYSAFSAYQLILEAPEVLVPFTMTMHEYVWCSFSAICLRLELAKVRVGEDHLFGDRENRLIQSQCKTETQKKSGCCLIFICLRRDRDET